LVCQGRDGDNGKHNDIARKASNKDNAEKQSALGEPREGVARDFDAPRWAVRWAVR